MSQKRCHRLAENNGKLDKSESGITLQSFGSDEKLKTGENIEHREVSFSLNTKHDAYRLVSKNFCVSYSRGVTSLSLLFSS